VCSQPIHISQTHAMISRSVVPLAAGCIATLAAAYVFRKRSKALPPAAAGVEDFRVVKKLGPFESFGDLLQRFQCWIKLLREYPKLVSVFEEHKANGWFDYGTPPERFDALLSHVATKVLLGLRKHRRFKSTLEFEADHAILPTYLPIEEGAAAAIGAVSLAAAELFELRTGRAQRCVVSQSGAGLTTAQYLFVYVQPSGKWGGLHGFDGTMAAEGTVKPQRKAYECSDGRWIFLHGGFPKLKKGLTDFLQCECTVPAMSAACKKWTADELETAMQVIAAGGH